MASLAAPYSADDRQAIALIALPLFMMAFAIATSQTVRFQPSWSDTSPGPAAASDIAPPAANPIRLRRQAVAAQPQETLKSSFTGATEIIASRNSAPELKELPLSPRSATGPTAAAGTPVQLPEIKAVSVVPPLDPARPLAEFSGRTSELPAIPPSDGGAIEVAVLDVAPPATTPQIPVTQPAAGAEGKSGICVADADADMRRVAALGPALPSNNPEAFGLALATAAREQLDDFVIYTDKYQRMSYPMGDVPKLYGVCTDVIIRAYRDVGIDLQRLVHEARVGSGDRNIDHRRVDTLRRFFAKFGESVPITDFAEDYRAGDVVTYYRPQNRHSRTHIAIVSDIIGPSGRPMIIHNRGWGPQQEDALFVDQITGHYRYAGGPVPATKAAEKASGPDARARNRDDSAQKSLGKAPVVRASLAEKRASRNAETR